MASTDARPVPQKNTAYRVTFPIFDNDGDLVSGAAGLDSEVSIDGGTFSDCTNEATEIATSSGMYFLDLTAAEMNGDTIAIIVKTTTTDAKTTPIVLYPEEAGDIRVNATQISDSGAAADSVESNIGNLDAAVSSRSDFDEASDNVTLAAATHTGATVPTVTDVTNRVTANTDQLNGDAAAAAALALSAGTIVSGAAVSGTLSTTQMTTDLTEATDSHFNGRIIIWTSGVLQNQGSDITAYDGSSKMLTYSAVTEAPSAGDSFIII